MKIKIYLLCVILLLTLLSGCIKLGGNKIENITYPDGNIKKDIDTSIKKALQSFATNNSDTLFLEEDNLCYSPTSLYFALSMLANGAANNSLDQMLTTLDIEDIEEHNKEMQKLYQSLYTKSDQTTFLIANSLWANKDVDISSEFRKKIASDYYGAINKTDFSNPEKAATLISKWISENTNNLIEPEVTVYETTIAMLVNAIYLTDLWLHDFDEGLTKEDTFHLANNQTTEADFMNMVLYSKDILEDDSSTVVSLPLQEFGDVLFILPKEDLQFEDYKISSSLDDYFNGELNKKTVDTLSLKIPKYKVESDLYLIDYLRGLGIIDVFGGNANLSKMTTFDAFVSEVRQGTTFEINEYGIEGAAYTSIRADSAADESLDVFDFHLDRPFFFMVVDNDNIPIFIGKIMSP